MLIRRISVAAALLIFAACSSRGNSPNGALQTFPKVRVVVRQGTQRLVVNAEVATNQEQWSQGLMFRTSVPKGTGMLFVFPQPIRAGFWMKNTLVELQVLFIRSGRVVEIRNMKPCKADPCPETKPRVDYDSALEIPYFVLGSLNVGASVEVFGNIPTPSSSSSG